MVDISAVALSGLRASETRLAVAATNVANQDTTGFKAQDVQLSADANGGGVRTDIVDRSPATIEVANDNEVQEKPNVSPDEEVANAQVATYNFKANLKVLKTEDDLQQSLLDIRA